MVILWGDLNTCGRAIGDMSVWKQRASGMYNLTSDSHRHVYFSQLERLSWKPVLAIQSVVCGEVTRGGASS